MWPRRFIAPGFFFWYSSGMQAPLSVNVFDVFFEVVFDPSTLAYEWLQVKPGAKVTFAVKVYLKEIAKRVLPGQGASAHDVATFYRQEFDRAVEQGYFHPWNGQLDSRHSWIDVTTRVIHLQTQQQVTAALDVMKDVIPSTDLDLTVYQTKPRTSLVAPPPRVAIDNLSVDKLSVAKQLAPKTRCYNCGPDRCICRLVDRG